MQLLKITESIKNEILKLTEESMNTIDDLTKFKKIPENALENYYKTIKKPVIAIKADVMQKMQTLVDKSTTEISWHGFVHRNPEKQIYHIYDITLFPQINTACATTTDQEKYAEWLQEYILNPNSNFEDIRMHGHSHVDMSVFSSGIDDTYQHDLLKNCPENDYYIFFIMNKRREICILLYDFTQQILFETKDIKLEIISNDNLLFSKWADEMIKEYCTTTPKEHEDTFCNTNHFPPKKRAKRRKATWI